MTVYFMHLDLRLTVTGVRKRNRPVLLVPTMETRDSSLKESVGFGNEILDSITKNLEKRGMIVLRNPIPVVRDPDPDYHGRLWIGYYNNVVVETLDSPQQRTVWLPKFELSQHSDLSGEEQLFLSEVALQNEGIWKSLGFSTKFISEGLSHFYQGGARGGGLRCLTVDFR